MLIFSSAGSRTLRPALRGDPLDRLVDVLALFRLGRYSLQILVAGPRSFQRRRLSFRHQPDQRHQQVFHVALPELDEHAGGLVEHTNGFADTTMFLALKAVGGPAQSAMHCDAQVRISAWACRCCDCRSSQRVYCQLISPTTTVESNHRMND